MLHRYECSAIRVFRGLQSSFLSASARPSCEVAMKLSESFAGSAESSSAVPATSDKNNDDNDMR